MGSDDDDDDDDDGGCDPLAPPNASLPLEARCHHYGREALFHLAQFVRWKAAVVRRCAVPVRRLVGARLVTLDYARPRADLPCVPGDVSVAKLGQPGEDGMRAASGTAACKVVLCAFNSGWQGGQDP